VAAKASSAWRKYLYQHGGSIAGRISKIMARISMAYVFNPVYHEKQSGGINGGSDDHHQLSLSENWRLGAWRLAAACQPHGASSKAAASQRLRNSSVSSSVMAACYRLTIGDNEMISENNDVCAQRCAALLARGMRRRTRGARHRRNQTIYHQPTAKRAPFCRAQRALASLAPAAATLRAPHAAAAAARAPYIAITRAAHIAAPMRFGDMTARKRRQTAKISANAHITWHQLLGMTA
jgi:hypothetical protein